MSSVVRQFATRNKKRKGLGSTGEPKGPPMVARASPQGTKSPVYRCRCHRCHGTGVYGSIEGRPVPCGCLDEVPPPRRKKVP